MTNVQKAYGGQELKEQMSVQQQWKRCGIGWVFIEILTRKFTKLLNAINLPRSQEFIQFLGHSTSGLAFLA
jgi:hypothetical protein